MDDVIADRLEGPGGPEEPGEPVSAKAPPEARGPHLPDVLTRSPVAWAFVILALARLIWFVRETQLGPAPELATYVSYVAGVIPAVASVLAPAALLLRHPDAPTRARTLFVGTVLMALGEGLRVLGVPLQPIFEQVTPGSEETPYLVPLALIYSSAVALLSTYAIASIGLGLAQRRRFADRSGTWLIALVAVLFVLLMAAARVDGILKLPFDVIPMTPTVILYLASTVVLGILSVAAWAYLAAVTVRGARAGEEPESGWTIGALASLAIVVAFGVNAGLSFATATPETQALLTGLAQTTAVVFAIGYLGLIVGLLLGLPSLEAPVYEDDDEEPDDDEAMAEATEVGDASADDAGAASIEAAEPDGISPAGSPPSP